MYRTDVGPVRKIAPNQYHSLQFVARKPHFCSPCISFTMSSLCSVLKRSELLNSDHTELPFLSVRSNQPCFFRTPALQGVLQRGLIMHNILWIWTFCSTFFHKWTCTKMGRLLRRVWLFLAPESGHQPRYRCLTSQWRVISLPPHCNLCLFCCVNLQTSKTVGFFMSV